MQKRYIINLLGVLFLLTMAKATYSQGCSDAGICTVDGVKGYSFSFYGEEETVKNWFKSGITYGLGEFGVNVFNPYLEYSYMFSDKISMVSKLTYAYIDGGLGTTNGLGDVILTGNFILMQKEKSSISLVVGGKVPLNKSDRSSDGDPLPMHYQTSLGTYDLLVGLSYSYGNLGTNIAWQQPIINANENEFMSPADQTLEASKYLSTNSFERKGDVIARVSYAIPFKNNKWVLRPSILGIYHLGEDTYVDNAGVEQKISGSQGLTLNNNIFLNYSFSDRKQLEFSIGAPFVTREARPDGLTRGMVIGLQYSYSF